MSDYGYGDYYSEPSEFEQMIDGFADELRGSVKKEITAEIERLTTENAEMIGKLKNLDDLERAAKDEKRKYEMALSNAKYEAKRQVQKEGLTALMALVAEPRFRVCNTGTKGPKCDKCDDDRNLNYETPRGRKTYERCICADPTYRYEAEEVFAQQVTKRNGEIMVWYETIRKYQDDADYFESATVLKNPAGVSLDDLVKRPGDYGYSSQEDAQRVADALNAEPTA